MDAISRRGDISDADALAALAEVTFPLACPPDAPQEAIAAFIAENLSTTAFARYLQDPSRTLLVAQAIVTSGSGHLLAYSMMVDAPPSDMDVASVVTESNAVELSKFYAHPQVQGLGVAAELMRASLDWVSAETAKTVWLGVNAENMRAQSFYAKQGFTIAGTRSFRLGTRVEHDYVMVRPGAN